MIRWLRARPPWLLVLAGWLAFVAYAYPGLVTRDTYDQLMEVRAGVYSDGHPPVMQAIWSVVEWFISGTFGMLLLQTALFAFGAQRVLRRVVSPHRAAVLAVAVLWFPPVGAVMAVVWKDCLMAGCLMMGLGLLLEGGRTRQVLGLVSLWFAGAVRYNAFAATLPVVVLLFAWPGLVGWRRFAIAVGTWFAITATTIVANQALTDRPMHLWYSSLAPGDIAGTLHYIPRTIPDARLRRALAGVPLTIDHDLHAFARAHYRPDSLLPLVLPGPDQMFDLPLDRPVPEQLHAPIARAWRKVVFGHWIAYLEHRAATFGAILGLVGDSWNGHLIVTHDYQPTDLLTAAGAPVGYSWSQHVIDRIYDAFTHTPLFRPYVYFAIGLCLVWLARRQRDALAILASGLVLEASLFPLGPSSDYRYSHWMIVTTCVVAIVLFVRRYRGGGGQIASTSIEPARRLVDEP